MNYYTKQEQRLPLITANMYRENPDQVVDILNRLIRFYEQYRDDSYQAITKTTTSVIAADDVINGIQTDITNIHGDLNGLSTVAHTGDYNDLLNIPPAAAVNNGKLTINQNGTKIAEFTANQAGNTTANITAVNPYPVGAIYLSVDSTNPGTIFGGTWQRIQDTFLLAAGSTYAAGSTGGEATHTLTVDEMPSHRHQLELGLQDWADSNGYEHQTMWRSQKTHPATSEYAGGGQAHNNMPPYLAVYVWKRTA